MAQRLPWEKYAAGCEYCVIDDCSAFMENYDSFKVKWKIGSQIEEEKLFYYDD